MKDFKHLHRQDFINAIQQAILENTHAFNPFLVFVNNDILKKKHGRITLNDVSLYNFLNYSYRTITSVYEYNSIEAIKLRKEKRRDVVKFLKAIELHTWRNDIFDQIVIPP